MKEKETMYDCPWGIKSSQKPKENWQEDWDCLMEYDEEAYFVTKKTYFHDNEDFFLIINMLWNLWKPILLIQMKKQNFL